MIVYEEITDEPRVVAALDELPAGERDRAARELAGYLTMVGAAKVDEVAAELVGGPRRAPHWRMSHADLLRKDARRRAALADPVWAVFDMAADVAEDVYRDV